MNNIVRTYGSRIARRAILEKYCPDGHPVLEIENHLIEMAAASLAEAMVKQTSSLKDVILAVRKAAIAQIEEFDEEDSVKTSVLHDIVHMTDSEILPKFN